MVLVHPKSALHDDPALEESADAKNLLEGGKVLLKTSQDSSVSSSDATEATAVESDDEQATPLSAAKATLKEMLAKHNRSAKHPEVAKAVEDLAALNPTSDAARSPYLQGCFMSLTRPEFPGRLKQAEGNEHIDQFTLGRMSFNIFQPKDLVCTIIKTQNDLVLLDADQDESEGENNGRNYTYPVVTHVIIHTPKGDFPASLHMKASCTSHKQPKNRLGVTFKGGTMCPGKEVTSDPSQMVLWKEVFAGAYKKAEEERSLLARFMQYIFKWMFQLSTPTDEEAEANISVSFEMKRCPHGFIDVLYLDEDLRITKGNRGSIVIVERIAEDGEDSE